MNEKLILTEADLQSEAFRLADPIERGTWLTLKAAAAKRGGNVIEGAGQWDERVANIRLDLRRRDLSRDSQLWWWVGRDLHVASAEYARPDVAPAEPMTLEQLGAAAGVAPAQP